MHKTHHHTPASVIELHRATAPDGATLHMMRRNVTFLPYVVCWHWDGASWDWGTYCNSYDEAQKAYEAKRKENSCRPTYIRTPRGMFEISSMTPEQARAEGYSLHHEHKNYYIMVRSNCAIACTLGQ